jgi:hypothetical protein
VCAAALVPRVPDGRVRTAGRRSRIWSRLFTLPCRAAPWRCRSGSGARRKQKACVRQNTQHSARPHAPRDAPAQPRTAAPRSCCWWAWSCRSPWRRRCVRARLAPFFARALTRSSRAQPPAARARRGAHGARSRTARSGAAAQADSRTAAGSRKDRATLV